MSTENAKQPLNSNKPMDERILDFLNSRKSDDFIPINDFLKSLFPFPVKNAPPVWTRQEEVKKLKKVLIDLKENGRVVFESDRFMELGRPYYADNDPVTRYRGLADVLISAKLR